MEAQTVVGSEAVKESVRGLLSDFKSTSNFARDDAVKELTGLAVRFDDLRLCIAEEALRGLNVEWVCWSATVLLRALIREKVLPATLFQTVVQELIQSIERVRSQGMKDALRDALGELSEIYQIPEALTADVIKALLCNSSRALSKLALSHDAFLWSQVIKEWLDKEGSCHHYQTLNMLLEATENVGIPESLLPETVERMHEVITSKKQSGDSRYQAVCVLGEIAKRGQLPKELGQDIIQEMLQCIDDGGEYNLPFNALGAVSNACGVPDTLRPRVVESLLFKCGKYNSYDVDKLCDAIDEYESLRPGIVDGLLQKLAGGDGLAGMLFKLADKVEGFLKPIASGLVQMLKNESNPVGSRPAIVLLDIARRIKLPEDLFPAVVDALLECLKDTLECLKDDNWGLHGYADECKRAAAWLRDIAKMGIIPESQQQDVFPVLFRCFVSTFSPYCFSFCRKVLDAEDSDINMLVDLAGEHENHRQMVISGLFSGGLLSHCNDLSGVLIKLAGHDVTLCQQVVKGLLQVKGYGYEHHRTVANSVLISLAGTEGVLRQLLVEGIFDDLKNSKRDEWDDHIAVLLGKIANEHSDLRLCVVKEFLQWLGDGDRSIRYSAVTVMSEVAKNSAIPEELLAVVTQTLLQSLIHEDADVAVRRSTAVALQWMAVMDNGLCSVIIPGLLQSLKDEHLDVRCSAVNALGEIAKRVGIPETLHSDVVFGILQLPDGHHHSYDFIALGALVKSGVIPETMREDFVQRLCEGCGRWGDLRSNANELLDFVGEREGLRDRVIQRLWCGSYRRDEDASTTLIALASSRNDLRRCVVRGLLKCFRTDALSDSAASVLVRLAKDGVIPDDLHPVVIERLIKDINNGCFSEHVAVVLEVLAKGGSIPEELCSEVVRVLLILATWLRGDWRGCHTAVCALGAVAKNCSIPEDLRVPVLRQLTKAVNGTDSIIPVYTSIATGIGRLFKSYNIPSDLGKEVVEAMFKFLTNDAYSLSKKGVPLREIGAALREVAGKCSDLCPDIVRKSLKFRKNRYYGNWFVLAEVVMSNSVSSDLRQEIVQDLIKELFLGPEPENNKKKKKKKISSEPVQVSREERSNAAAALGELSRVNGIPESLLPVVLEGLFECMKLDYGDDIEPENALCKIAFHNVIPQASVRPVVQGLLQGLTFCEPGGSAAATAIAEFVKPATVSYDLCHIVVRALLEHFKDWYSWEDRKLRSLITTFGEVVKNNNVSIDLCREVVEEFLEKLKNVGRWPDYDGLYASMVQALGGVANGSSTSDDLRRTIVEELFRRLRNNDTRRSAAVALGEVGGHTELGEVVSGLMGCLEEEEEEEEEDRDVRDAAVVAFIVLVGKNPDAACRGVVPKLLHHLGGSEKRVIRRSAAAVLKEVAKIKIVPTELSQEVVQGLLQGLGDGDGSVRIHVAVALGEVAKQNTIPDGLVPTIVRGLIHRLGDGVGCVRHAAAVSLGQLTDISENLFEVILQELFRFEDGDKDDDEDDNNVRTAVGSLLQILRTKTVSEALRQAVTQRLCRCYNENEVEVVEEEEAAISTNEDLCQRVVRGLNDHLRDGDDSVQSTAAVMLDRVIEINGITESLCHVVVQGLVRLLSDQERRSVCCVAAAVVGKVINKSSGIPEKLGQTVVEKLFKGLGDAVIRSPSVSALIQMATSGTASASGNLLQTIIDKSLQHLKNKDAMVRCSAATVLREVAASGVVAEDLCPNIMVRTSLQNLRDGKRLSQHHCEASRSVGAETLEKLAKNNTIPGDLRGDVVEELLKCIKVMRPEYTHNRWGRKVMCKSSTVDDDYADVSSTSAAALGELAKFGGIPEDQRVAVIKRLFHGLQDVHARRSAAAAIGEIVKSNIVPQDLRQAVIHKLLECVNDEDVHQIAVSSLVKLTFEQSTSTERVNSSCEDADEDMAEGENEDEEPTNACRGRLCSSSEATVQDLEWRGDWHKRVLTGDIDEVLQLIMNKDGGVDEKEHGLTALHLAAIVGDGDVALALIQAGADMNARDSHGQTPLHLGVLNGHPHILELLLNWHATDVHAIDNNGVGAFKLPLTSSTQ